MPSRWIPRRAAAPPLEPWRQAIKKVSMRLLKWLGAAALALHGFAHLVGVTDLWRLVEPETGFRTAFLDGRWEPATPVLYGVGGLWLAAAAGFAVAAYALVRGRTWLVSWTAATAIASLALSALAWPEAHIGVYLNLALLLVLLLARVPLPGRRTLSPAR
jgi:hypothetical protein